MQVKNLFAAAAIVFATGSAFASEVTPWPEYDNFKSTKTRAEVVSELKQAQAEGKLIVGDITPEPAFVSTQSRSQVSRELLQERSGGKYDVAASRSILDTTRIN